MASKRNILAIDVGEKRIGVAVGDTQIKIAIPYDTIEVDGTEILQLRKLAALEKVDTIVVGYPRNQSGEDTQQTRYVQEFAENLQPIDVAIEFQDESLTSVQAEERLRATKKPYVRGDIDKVAASIILQDYLERR